MPDDDLFALRWPRLRLIDGGRRPCTRVEERPADLRLVWDRNA